MLQPREIVLALHRLGSTADEVAQSLHAAPECIAVRDVLEKLIVLRVEMTALTGLLMERGLITREAFQDAMATEALALDQLYERTFPGFTTSLVGVHVKMPEAAETMKGWPS